jgi:hypothetical protein
MSNFTLNVSQSGSFLQIGDACSPRIFNPGVYEDRRNSYQISEKQETIAKWRLRNTGKKKWKFTAAQIDGYADAAVKLTAAVSSSDVPCRLAPLRGAARPCMLVEVMSGGAFQFEFFDFRNGSKGFRDREISESLISILNHNDPHTELFRIQVVDTAKGGHGINKLISLLRDIHHGRQNFRDQFWEIDIHLLYPNDGEANINNLRSVGLLRDGKFEIILSLYPVPKIVGEDYDEASDFDFVMDGNLLIPRPRAVGGGFVLEEQGTERLIETDNVFLTFDEFFSEAVTHALLTDPNRALAEIVWQKVQNKK